jgi:hypothetical protein
MVKLGITQKNIGEFDLLLLIDTYIAITQNLGEKDFKML